MAYEVTKRIGGREYRYHVSAYRDPKTNKPKQKWTYLGRVNGLSVVATRERPAEDARARITHAIVQLLEKRDVAHVTIDVIARAARVSRSTFYRFFADKNAAILDTVDVVLNDVFRCPDKLEESISSRDDERAKLAAWARDLLTTAIRFRGLRRALEASPEIRVRHGKRTAVVLATVQEHMVRHFRAMRDAGMIETSDPDLLGRGLAAVLQGVGKMLVSGEVELTDDVLRSVLEVVDRAVFGQSPSPAAATWAAPRLVM